jgi:hypothetical protein
LDRNDAKSRYLVWQYLAEHYGREDADADAAK